MPKVVSKADFARYLKVSRARVTQYCHMGMPQHFDGKLDLEVARTWVRTNIARDSYRTRSEPSALKQAPTRGRQADRTLAQERTRLAKAQADAQELKNAQLRRELIPADEAIAGWQASIGRARSLLLGLPAGMAEQAVALVRREPDDAKAAHAVRERLTDEIYAALEELANTDLDDDEDDEQSAA